jgi:hypothetical protein
MTDPPRARQLRWPLLHTIDLASNAVAEVSAITRTSHCASLWEVRVIALTTRSAEAAPDWFGPRDMPALASLNLENNELARLAPEFGRLRRGPSVILPPRPRLYEESLHGRKLQRQMTDRPRPHRPAGGPQVLHGAPTQGHRL